MSKNDKKDQIKDWYNLLEKKNKEDKNFEIDKNFDKHGILPTSMICLIAGTGGGKSTAFMEFLLERKKNTFCEVIIFNPVNVDEPIYNFLKKINNDVQLIDDIEDLPDLKDYDDNKKTEKLLICDDIITMNNKDLKKIESYLISSRKFGFTCIVMCQNYVSLSKKITRNISYFCVFKLNDNVSINTIIKNHNIYGIDKDYILECYRDAVVTPKDFLMFDCHINGEKNKCLRHNFTDYYDIPDKNY